MTTDAVGGVWRYSVDLTNELIARGVDVLLACLGPLPSAKQKTDIGSLPPARLVALDCALEWMEQPWADVDRSAEWLQQLAREFQPDVLHLNGYSYAGADYGAPVLVVAHSCVRSWWRAVHQCQPPADEWAEYERRVSAGLRAADAIVAPSRFMADAIADEYGIEHDRIQVVYNFLRGERLATSEKQPLLLAAGRMWDKAKNLGLLETIRGRLDWGLLIADGQLSRKELDRELARASIFLHPALYEPFGLAVLEAAQAGCALVLADIPSLRELWHGAAAFCDPRDPEAWVAMLAMLLHDERQRSCLQQAAITRAKRFSPETTVNEYLRVYKEL
jgi:glycosyltransferase involved in cell wall biosynthesis